MARLLGKNSSVQSKEWGIKNYLEKHGITVDYHIIISSFVDNPDMNWKDKILYTQEHFGLFAQYAHNNFKQKQ